MLTFFVITPILIAVFLYLFPFQRAARIISIITQSIFTIAAFHLFTSSREETIITVVGDYGILGITLRADALSSAFILLTAFIFLIAAIYSFSSNTSSLFWFLLFIWEASLIGIFLSSDIFNVFVLTEVGTVVVSVLIMYNRKERSMYDGMIYLMINVVIMQFYLFGLGFVYRQVGVLDFSAVAEALGMIDTSQQILPYALIITFVALKCALLPLYSWLPKAHGTPGASAAVSAVLSGLHIKSGLYLFLRFQEIFEGVATRELFLVIGIFTAFAGIIMSLAQTNIKLVLAYSTVAQMGLIIIGFNIGSEHNYIGSLYHIVTHGIFKTALFLGTGVLIQTYGTRNIRKIQGAFKLLPITGITTGLAILGIIGAPFFSGSVSKYFLMYDAGGFLNALLIMINLGTVIIFVKYAAMFFGKPQLVTHSNQLKKNIDWWQQAPLIVLGILCFVLGIFGERAILFLFNVSKNIDTVGYLQKSGIFILSLVAGCLAFRYYVRDSVLFNRIKKFELGFRGMCAAIGVFFAVVVIWLFIC